MNLQLSLKTKWFEMTKAGIKTEDYREISLYWKSRLLYRSFTLNECGVNCINIGNRFYKLKPFSCNTMTLGYPKSNDTERIIKYEHAGIEIRTGNPEWGAEPDKLYFVIKHGKQIN